MVIKKGQQKPTMELTVDESAGNFVAHSSVYDSRFLALLTGLTNKKKIAIYRTMFPDGSVSWEIDPALFDPFISIAGDYYDVIIPGDKKSKKKTGPKIQTDLSDSDPYSQFLRLAPNNVLTQIHKLMVFALHPDKGGDTVKMQNLNDSWREIKKERGL